MFVCVRVLGYCHRMDSLFGRIGELVLSPPVVAFLDAGIRPQILDRLHVRRIERGDRLEVDALHELRVFLESARKSN